MINIEAIIAVAIALVVGIVIGEIIGVKETQHKAIQHEVAHYDRQTGIFTWNQ